MVTEALDLRCSCGYLSGHKQESIHGEDWASGAEEG